jgi:hypothetical protein
MQCGIFQTYQKNLIWYLTTKASGTFQPEPQCISYWTNKSHISAWIYKFLLVTILNSRNIRDTFQPELGQFNWYKTVQNAFKRHISHQEQENRNYILYNNKTKRYISAWVEQISTGIKL